MADRVSVTTRLASTSDLPFLDELDTHVFVDTLAELILRKSLGE